MCKDKNLRDHSAQGMKHSCCLWTHTCTDCLTVQMFITENQIYFSKLQLFIPVQIELIRHLVENWAGP